MNVEAILSRKGADVVTVASDCPVTEVARILCEHRIGAVVVRDDEVICGVMSERDVVRALCHHGAETLALKASDLMTREVLSCRLRDAVDHLMALMTDRHIRHLPVIEDGRLLGIISIGDVVKNKIRETEYEAEAMRSYIASG